MNCYVIMIHDIISSLEKLSKTESSKLSIRLNQILIRR